MQWVMERSPGLGSRTPGDAHKLCDLGELLFALLFQVSYLCIGG